ncbi:MAG TPA: hypothetical protein VK111_03075 [Virgibacillus sp.]|nr:hypothetical protein [Virgibacillus sp.]
MTNDQKETNLIDVWEDRVDIKDILIAMILCITFAMGGYILDVGSIPPLISGLIGAVTGFIISSIIIKPKRHVTMMEEGDE